MLGQAVGRLSGASCDHTSGVGLRRARKGPLNRKESNPAHPGLQPTARLEPTVLGASWGCVCSRGEREGCSGRCPRPGPFAFIRLTTAEPRQHRSILGNSGRVPGADCVCRRSADTVHGGPTVPRQCLTAGSPRR